MHPSTLQRDVPQGTQEQLAVLRANLLEARFRRLVASRPPLRTFPRPELDVAQDGFQEYHIPQPSPAQSDFAVVLGSLSEVGYGYELQPQRLFTKKHAYHPTQC